MIAPYYVDDAVTIYHGDAREVLSTIRVGSVDAVITDPPYVIGAASAGSMGSKSGTWHDMMNSALWFTSWYREVNRILRHTGVFWSFCNWRSLPVVMRAAMDAELPITSLAVWDKQWIGPGGSQGLRPSYELVALMCQAGFSIPDRGVADIFPCKVGSYKPNGHPAEKPEGIVQRLLAVSALTPGSLVVDPFLGSGTTAKVAKSAGLKVIGIEADERWCEVAAERVSQGALDFGGAA